MPQAAIKERSLKKLKGIETMTTDRLGGIALIVGALLFATYSALFTVTLPIVNIRTDFVSVVLDSAWKPLALTALIGIVLMLIGFYAVYGRLHGTVAAAGFLAIEAAYLLQACKVTWELFLYPIIASHSASAFLLNDAVILHDPGVAALGVISSLAIFTGIVLFCFALYRSDAYPKAAAVLIFAGALVYALGPMISLYFALVGIFTLAIGCFMLGLKLYRG